MECQRPREKLLITGGMGFIGAPMVRRFAETYTVTVADRLDFGVAPEVEPLVAQGIVELVAGDLVNALGLQARIMEGEFDAIIHLSALHYIPACERKPTQAYHDNVLAALALLSQLPSRTKFINFSSASVYRPARRPHHEERSRLGPSDVYGWSKKHLEDLARYYARARGLSILNIRLFNAVGPGETNPHVLPTILWQLQNGRAVIEVGNLSPKRDFIHIEDIAEAVEKLLQAWPIGSSAFESYNLGTGCAVSVRGLVTRIMEQCGREVRIRAVASRRRRLERPLLCADVTKLKSVLPDFKPKTLDEWLPDVARDPRLRIKMDCAEGG